MEFFLLLIFLVFILGALNVYQMYKKIPTKKTSQYKSSQQFGRNAVEEAPYKWKPDLDYDIKIDRGMGNRPDNGVRLIKRSKDKK